MLPFSRAVFLELVSGCAVIWWKSISSTGSPRRHQIWEPFFDAVLKGENGNVIPLISSDPYWGRQWWPNYYGYDPIDGSIGAPGSRGLVGVKLDDPR